MPESASTTTPTKGRFPYNDGIRDRFGDPLKIQLRMARACPNGDLLAINEFLNVLNPPRTPEPTEGREPTESPGPPPMAVYGTAVESLDPIITVGFDLPPYDEETGAGLVSMERIRLLTSFLTFLVPAKDAEQADEESDTTETDIAEPTPE